MHSTQHNVMVAQLLQPKVWKYYASIGLHLMALIMHIQRLWNQSRRNNLVGIIQITTELANKYVEMSALKMFSNLGAV